MTITGSIRLLLAASATAVTLIACAPQTSLTVDYATVTDGGMTGPAAQAVESPPQSETRTEVSTTSTADRANQDVWWIHGPRTYSFEEEGRPESLAELATKSSTVALVDVVDLAEGRDVGDLGESLASTIISLEASQRIGDLEPGKLSIELPRSREITLDQVRDSLTSDTYLLFASSTTGASKEYGGSVTCTSPGLCILAQSEHSVSSPLAPDAFMQLTDSAKIMTLDSAFEYAAQFVKVK